MNPYPPIHTGNEQIDHFNTEMYQMQNYYESQRMQNEIQQQNMETQNALRRIRNSQNAICHTNRVRSNKTTIVNDTVGSALVKGIISILCLLIVLFFLDKWQVPQAFIQQIQKGATESETIDTKHVDLNDVDVDF